MRIDWHEPDSAASLMRAFERRGLVYGDGASYASLVSPASVVLSANEVHELSRDLSALAELYRTTTSLYLASLDGEAPGWIRTCVEYGLSSLQREAHELIARTGLEPIMCRADYVEVGDSRRQLAEVQWKSGGPGLLIGHQAAYADVYPLRIGTSALGDLETTYLAALAATDAATPRIVVNEVRPQWLRGEAQLAARASDQGWSYRPLNRETIAGALAWTEDGLCLREGGATAAVTTLRGRGFTEALPDDLTLKLARAAARGEMWIEAPLNFLYRQKWCLALPFIEELAEGFSDRAREIVIPTALVRGEDIDLAPIADRFATERADEIAGVRTLADLPSLPGGLRRQLVLKSGAGVGEFHSRGRGVFRLAGSRGSADGVVKFVRSRLTQGEPWILQPFVDRKDSVPLATPKAINEIAAVDCHSRLMVFGERKTGRTWRLQGAIGNFARHWKVSGSPAGSERAAEARGSAFVDVRSETAADWRGEEV